MAGDGGEHNPADDPAEGERGKKKGICRVEIAAARLNCGGDGASTFAEVVFSDGANAQRRRTE
eukprot:gene15469-48340_t